MPHKRCPIANAFLELRNEKVMIDVNYTTLCSKSRDKRRNMLAVKLLIIALLPVQLGINCISYEAQLLSTM